MIAERTLILIKPDGVQRGMIGHVFTRLEMKGFKLCALKLVSLDRKQAEEFYSAHRGKYFFDRSVKHISSGPMVASVWEGIDIIHHARMLIGSAEDAAPGTIRADWALDVTRNVVHGSDSPDAARREIAMFFTESEILGYSRDIDRWI